MNPPSTFYPERRKGLIIHIAFSVVFLALGAIAFIAGLRQQVGAYFVMLLLLALLLFAPLPLLFYRAYSLVRARYDLDRDGLHLQWGLRVEDIPLPLVEWVKRPDELAYNLPSPRPSWPGSLMGTLNVEGLGPVEYLASNTDDLLLVATPTRIFAISPDDPDEFVRTYNQVIEMGSLTPLPAYSVLPTAYLTQIWRDPFARWMLLAGLVLALLLFTGVSLGIPGRQEVSLGFLPDGSPMPPVPAAQMLLLPFLSLFFFILNLSISLFFYRRNAYRPLSYLLWGSSVVTTLLLAIAAALILL